MTAPFPDTPFGNLDPDRANIPAFVDSLQAEPWDFDSTVKKSGVDLATTADVDNVLPNQTGNNGKFLGTNGSIASWQTVAGSGTVTSVSVTPLNGVSAVVTDPATTPALAFALGAITPSSVAASGTIGGSNFSGSSSGTNTGDQDLSGLVPKTTTVNGHALSSNVTVTKSDVSLGNVVNVDTTTTANISDSTNKRFVTDANLVVIGNTSGTNTGDQTISLTGDVTGSGTGSFAATITSNAVTTSKINNGAVTEAKMTLANNTTNNVTTSAHGFTPILPNDATKYLDGTGTYSVPPGTGPSGTVTSVDTAAANNGVTATWTSTTTAPRLTVGLGAITPSSVNSVIISGSSTPTLAVTGTTTVSGSNTGDQTTVSGNAGTATALQTARTINGVSFNGTADITVTAAAGTLTGTTLNSTVVTSSLTGVGTLVNLTVTNPISGSITGNAATVTTNANLTGDVISSGNATTYSGTVPVNKGGTGTTSLTAHGVVIGNATSAVNVTSAGSSGQVLTSNGASADPTFQAIPSTTTTALTLVPQPNFQNAATLASTAYPSNTTATLGQIVVPFGITINSLSFSVQAAVGSNTIKIALYSEDGQTKIFEVTSASIGSTGTKTVSVSSQALTPGIYYVVIIPQGASILTLRNWASVTTSTITSGVTSEPVLEGTITVTADTMPTNFTPSSVNFVANSTPYIRFDN